MKGLKHIDTTAAIFLDPPVPAQVALITLAPIFTRVSLANTVGRERFHLSIWDSELAIESICGRPEGAMTVTCVSVDIDKRNHGEYAGGTLP
jgi:hypothetical protein